MSNVSELLKIASRENQSELVGSLGATSSEESAIIREINQVLQLRNGFYAFESALHFFSSDYQREWNRADSWKSLYGLLEDIICFAEDVFGEQFCAYKQGLYRFNPETGELDRVAGNLEEWATTILSDYEVETGYIVAHEWQHKHGLLAPGKRLIPIKPFVLGGEYTVGNLRLVDAISGMRYRSNIARQIKGLPDGTQVRFVIK